MKIITLSDLHGLFPKDIPDGDVLVITGDICPADNHTIANQKWWLANRFNLWLKSLSFDKKHIVCIAGNHDWIFEKKPAEVPKLNCYYLEDSGVSIDGVNFYGYPHTPVFCNWAFNKSPNDLEEAANKIPDNTDVLLTHGPPYGILDTVADRYLIGYDPNETKHCGCTQLKKRVNKLLNLKLHVFGHIHSAHGIVKPSKLGKSSTTFVNASCVNESYELDYDIISVEI